MRLAPPSPWTLDPDAFPAEGSVDEQLTYLVRYAVLAPSNRNTQPWRFHAADGALEVWADRARALPVADPDGRALVMSCGAALYYLRLAAHHYGFGLAVERLPDSAQPDLLARVRPGDSAPSTPEGDVLFDAIPRRRTNRRAFSRRFVPWYLFRKLDAAARAEGAWLTVVTEPADKARLADLVADGDRVQQADPAFREEQAAWIRALGRPEHDGLSGHALGLPRLLDAATPLVATLRWDERPEPRARRDRSLAQGAAALVVLGTADDTPEAWLRAGEALAHVLLRATAAGVSASFLNQPVEVAELRPRLVEAVGATGHAHVLLRLGFGPRLSPTARRGAPDVTDADA